MKPIPTILLVGFFLCLPAVAEVKVAARADDVVKISNDLLEMSFCLRRGIYGGMDLVRPTLNLTYASWSMDDWTSSDPANKHQWAQEEARDELGAGKALIIRSRAPGGPEHLLRVVVYEGEPFVVMSGGVHNTTGRPLQVKAIRPLARTFDSPRSGLTSFDSAKGANLRIIDGFGGGEPLEWGKKVYRPVHRSLAVASRNNLLATSGTGEDRRTLTLGGLTYHDYEKFAEIRQPRRDELEKGADGKKSLLCYLDLAREKDDGVEDGPRLRLVRGELEEHPHFGRFWCPEFSAYAVAKDRVVVEATDLDPGKVYTLGFSWWNMEKRAAKKPRVQSIVIDQGEGTKRHVLVDARTLPRWSNDAKTVAEQAEIPLPPESYASGKMRILVEHVEGNPQVAVSELWLRDGEAKPLLDPRPTSIDESPRPYFGFQVRLFAEDPVGKRVDPGKTYLPDDRFYLDFVTRNPFESLELYGRSVQKAQKIDLSRYDFPTVCLWYAHNKSYGGGGAENTSAGAVKEAEAIKASGFLNYSRAAVRLVPDTYGKNTAQGWWTDERFRMHGSSNLGEFEGGNYREPYETTLKWGRAVIGLGCIPLMYSQTGFRSEDYAEAFPGHMLFNKTHAWQDPGMTIPPDDEKAWAFPWGKAASLWSYDYTDQGFLAHLREIYTNWAEGGIKGLMFDYPASGWAAGGGMEDKYATTAAAYRTIFALPHELLGPGSFIHERSMERGTDVALGVTASQRTENDMDWISPSVVSRCGLRWYKNRVVINYDTDSKNLLKAAERSREELRSLLTMSYTVTGRLLLANSFTQFSPEIFHDLTRIYPFHTTPLTARPVDAFASDHPRVYHFRLSPDRHQVVFYNPEREKEQKISVVLAGDTADGTLGLDPDKHWHVHDFWNDRYVGEISGNDTLDQVLRPAEARMLALRAVAHHPQVVSSDRHLMQGMVELGDVAWDGGRRTLSGTVRLPAGEPVTLTLATSGRGAVACQVDEPAHVQIDPEGGTNRLIRVRIQAKENCRPKWQVTFGQDGASSAFGDERTGGAGAR